MLEQLREEVKKLLEDGKADFVIGYRTGTLPLRSTPLFIKEAKDVNALIFDPTCSLNLATYVKRCDGRVSVIAKGCDGRALVSLIVEKQLVRENVFIVGVECNGVIERRKVYEMVGWREIREHSFRGERLIIKGKGFEEEFPLHSILSPSCKACQYKTPPVYDLLIGEEREEEGVDEALKSFSEKAPKERWDYFLEELSRCMRCYACRQVCPVCICEYCIVDRTQPQWFGKGTHPSDIIAFHLVRAYHTAGRCVNCGACGRACPLGIDTRLMMRRLEEEIYTRFGFRAGLSLEKPPPLAFYKEEDPQEFIM